MEVRHGIDALDSNFSGYQCLLQLCSKVKGTAHGDSVAINFENCTWFRASLCAVLGAILSGVEKRGGSVIFEGLGGDVETFFSGNGFGSRFGGRTGQSPYKTTIPYCEFNTDDMRGFDSYISHELLSRNELFVTNTMINPLRKCLIEAFTNAHTHGEGGRAFTCGQLHPNKHVINFSVVNNGATIQQLVSNYKRQHYSAFEAIEWAVEEGNTTRSGNIPGGFGLSTILEIMRRNGGIVQIISGNTCWVSNGIKWEFQDSFEGTVVNLEFRTKNELNGGS